MPKAPPSTTTQRMSPYPMPNTQRPSRPSSPRPSGGAWSPQDDETLKTARSEGLSWAPIAQIYFPNKTGNACRKRHERLSEKKKGDNWDSLKLEQLAREYLDVRKDMWDMLASRVGEKWQDVEAICLEKGLKNLQSIGRNASRREPSSLCEGDSGIAGMDAEPGNPEDARRTEELGELVRRGGPDHVMRRTSFELPSIASMIHSTPQ